MTRIVVLPNENLCPEGAVIEADPGESICRALLRNDIEIDGRKISGTGGTESGIAFMFQGTMLVDFDVETMLRALRIPGRPPAGAAR